MVPVLHIDSLGRFSLFKNIPKDKAADLNFKNYDRSYTLNEVEATFNKAPSIIFSRDWVKIGEPFCIIIEHIK